MGMARHRDSRSPSPAGSHSSKRARRDDRDRRDDMRGPPRRRTRSRSLDVSVLPDLAQSHSDGQMQRRHRDRDAHRRRDRSIDRRADDYYRSGRRDARRYPDRERSPDRRRRRSRERDYRDRRDDSYDRAQWRREDSTDSWSRSSRGDDARGKPPSRPEPAKKTEVRKHPHPQSRQESNISL